MTKKTAWYRRTSTTLDMFKDLHYSKSAPTQMKDILETLSSPEVYGSVSEAFQKSIRVSLGKNDEGVVNQLALFNTPRSPNIASKNMFFLLFTTTFKREDFIFDGSPSEKNARDEFYNYLEQISPEVYRGLVTPVRTILDYFLNNPDFHFKTCYTDRWNNTLNFQCRFFDFVNYDDVILHSLRISFSKS